MLRIDNAQPADAGLYECRAGNGTDQLRKLIKVIVNGKLSRRAERGSQPIESGVGRVE